MSPRGRLVAGRRGAALILVLWIIVALAALASGAVAATRSSGGIAANYRARVVARYAAESGVALAVARLEAGLAAAVEPGERRGFLNQLGSALRTGPAALGDARLAVTLVDVGSRLDVNAADVGALTRLLSFFADPREAERTARAIRAHVAGDAPRDAFAPGAASAALATMRPLRAVEELFRIPGVPPELARRAARFLTVDGDGTINRATASDTVLAAAAGELRDEPSRILVIARGWLDGHPLTHEIEAVYAVVGTELSLIRWRERDL